MGEIDIGKIDDQEVFVLALCWSAMQNLEDAAFRRVIVYLANRRHEKLQTDRKTITDLIADVELLKRQSEAKP